MATIRKDRGTGTDGRFSYVEATKKKLYIASFKPENTEFTCLVGGKDSYLARYMIVSFELTMLDVTTSESMLILRNIRAEHRQVVM